MRRYNFQDLKIYIDKARTLAAAGALSAQTETEINTLIDCLLREICREMAKEIDRVIRKVEKRKSIMTISIEGKFKGKQLKYFKKLKKLVEEVERNTKGGKYGQL